MRALALSALCTVPAAAAAGFVLPRQRSAVFSPTVITLIAVVGCLWIGLTANRDAGVRLDRVKRAFAAHGDMVRLLRDHKLVYAVVLFRLECLTAVGLVVALWGRGPIIALWFFAATAAMIGLTWPSRRKTELLVARAMALR
jgi:hypothetical protein